MSHRAPESLPFPSVEPAGRGGGSGRRGNQTGEGKGLSGLEQSACLLWPLALSLSLEMYFPFIYPFPHPSPTI